MSPPLAIKHLVIPAKAGTHVRNNSNADWWIPAFAGMTISVAQ